eukprot:scaffold18047_cov36-Phaeocystis_antarctica.AAC.2
MRPRAGPQLRPFSLSLPRLNPLQARVYRLPSQRQRAPTGERPAAAWARGEPIVGAGATRNSRQRVEYD